MPQSIFISLTAQDTPIAEALQAAFRQLFGDTLQVHFSTSKEIGGGISHGADWFAWIIEKVQQCDFALILITPASVQKPWILWEAGAVHGAALASGAAGVRKVRPLVYRLDDHQIPSPFQHANKQWRRGDELADIKNLFNDVLHDYKETMSWDQISRAFSSLETTARSYLQAVTTSLLDAPAIPSSNVIEEWRLRLDELMRQNRQSEVEHLHDWMNIAFGRRRDEQAQPIDLRIHSRLAELYLKAKKHERAIEQLTLARQLAPRDIYVLRTLGRAYLDAGDRTRAWTEIERILQLDKDALIHNVECAALAARWYRESGDLTQAGAILGVALNANPDSYYLANVLAELKLEAGRLQEAADVFTRVTEIIERLHMRRESNMWTNATVANAAFFHGDDDKAVEYLQTIAASQPDANALATVEGGLRRIASHVDGGQARLVRLLQALGEKPPAQTAAAGKP